MLKINNEITDVRKVDSSKHNVARVNSIKVDYPVWRQDSKSPTFRTYLSGDVHYPDE